ncbi:hypothetical protein BpHYR1_005402 [Brachionus plicatilis]|uniref:Uncharacterized protein n=1 Tax=Brachionus plicatilis TaxID=10195 RepID=A0A3M7QGC9_BRAPC|nr:hypothetical protein BpHYR1_005402 [Brachionus plicatilis]
MEKKKKVGMWPLQLWAPYFLSNFLRQYKINQTLTGWTRCQGHMIKYFCLQNTAKLMSMKNRMLVSDG